jgi:hypothetical protein
VSNWRGILVLLFLALWPLIWFFSSLTIFGFGGQCAVDSCGPSPTVLEGVLYLLSMVAPPILAISIWVIWRVKNSKIKGLNNAI